MDAFIRCAQSSKDCSLFINNNVATFSTYFSAVYRKCSIPNIISATIIKHSTSSDFVRVYLILLLVVVFNKLFFIEQTITTTTTKKVDAFHFQIENGKLNHFLFLPYMLSLHLSYIAISTIMQKVACTNTHTQLYDIGYCFTVLYGITIF